MNLNYSANQNKTLSFIVDKILVVSSIVDKTFSVIFSSPLAIYFFSIFNYFTFLSLYVLLNMKIPDVIFHYLSIVADACQSNIFRMFGFGLQIDKVTKERVNEERP
jgi:hypothetical protein